MQPNKKHIEFIRLVARGENLLNHYKQILPSIGFYVYALLHPETGKVFYIGKGTKNRAYQHFKNVGSNQIKDKVILELKQKKLTYDVIIISEHSSEAEAYECEKLIINELGTQLTNIIGVREKQRFMPDIKNAVPVDESLITEANVIEMTIAEAKEKIKRFKKYGTKLFGDLYFLDGIIMKCKISKINRFGQIV